MVHKELDKYEIYIGLKDKDTLLETFTIDEFAQILSKQCQNKNIGFSMTTQFGGYAHEKGYITENSLRITLVGIEEKEVQELGDTLKQIINTHTILITKEKCDFSFR